MSYNIVNSYEINTIYGKKSIEICYEDLTNFPKPFDILILSSKSYSYFPVKGTLIHSLDEKNIHLYKLAKKPYLDLRNDLNIWISEELKSEMLNFKRIVCVEFEKDCNPINSFESILPFLSLIEKLDISVSTIAMPLLGTGHLNFSVEENLKLQLKLCELCLKNIPSLSKIYLVEKDSTKTIQLNNSLNTYFQRDEVQTKNIFFYKANIDILNALETNVYNLVQIKKIQNNNIDYEVLYDFYDQIKRKTLRYFELCSYSRKLIELLLAEQLKNNSNFTLQNAIDSYLRQANVSSWIISYMHVIRILSNNQIHYSNNNKIPNKIKKQDIYLVKLFISNN